MKDDRINQKFARTNVDRLIKEFVDQICQATGGPCAYAGRNMTEAHHNMGVTNGEWDAFVEPVEDRLIASFIRRSSSLGIAR